MTLIYSVLNAVLLALHLLAWNIAAAGPLVCIWLHWRAGRGDAVAEAVGRRMAWFALWALGAGSVIGFLLLGFMWVAGNGSYFDAFARFPASAWVYAGGELLFSVACLAVYIATWRRWLGRPWLHGLFAVMSATNLLYHFPPLMAVLGGLAAGAEVAGEAVITRDVFRGLMVRPDVVALSIHFVLASLAVAGGVVMLLAHRYRTKEQTSDATSAATSTLIAGGAWTALAATLAQLAAGLWLLLELPSGARDGLIGDDLVATGLFFVAVVVSFALMHVLAGVALGNRGPIPVVRSVWLMVAVVLLMAGTLTRARQIESGELDGFVRVVEAMESGET